MSANTDFQIDPVLKQALVNCFYETSVGTIWVGTRNGLFALEEGKEKASRYTTADGLPSNVIYGILEDAHNCLWISTNQGLSCLNPESGKFRNFTIMDGLQGNQFNANAYCRQADGNMLFGGVNGITSFRPETLVDNPYVPKPIINKLLVLIKKYCRMMKRVFWKKAFSTPRRLFCHPLRIHLLFHLSYPII